MLDPAERGARVGPDILVDEAHAGFELLRGDPPAAVEIRRQHARAKAELAGVSDTDRVGLILGRDDCRDWAEHLFVMRRLAGTNVRKDRSRVPGSRTVGDLTAEQQLCALGDAVLDLAMDF